MFIAGMVDGQSKEKPASLSSRMNGARIFFSGEGNKLAKVPFMRGMRKLFFLRIDYFHAVHFHSGGRG